MEELVRSVILDLVRFQRRAFAKNPFSAKKKRRVVCGLRECLRHAQLGRLCAVIIPYSMDDAILRSLPFVLLQRQCQLTAVPLVRTQWTDQQLGSFAGTAQSAVCCIGIVSADGCYEGVQEMRKLNEVRVKEHSAALHDMGLWQRAFSSGTEPCLARVCELVDEETGRQPVHICAMYGRLDLMRQLVGLRVPLGAVDRGGRTALHYAAELGDMETVRLLLDADPSLADLPDRQGRLPVELCVAGDDPKLLHCMLQSTTMTPGQRVSLAKQCLERKRSDCLQFLYRNRHVCKEDLLAMRPLQTAAAAGAIENVKWLVGELYPDGIPEAEYEGIRECQAGPRVLMVVGSKLRQSRATKVGQF